MQIVRITDNELVTKFNLVRQPGSGGSVPAALLALQPSTTRARHKASGRDWRDSGAIATNANILWGIDAPQERRIAIVHHHGEDRDKRLWSRHCVIRLCRHLIAPGSVPFSQADRPSSETSSQSQGSVEPPSMDSTTQQSCQMRCPSTSAVGWNPRDVHSSTSDAISAGFMAPSRSRCSSNQTRPPIRHS